MTALKIINEEIAFRCQMLQEAHASFREAVVRPPSRNRLIDLQVERKLAHQYIQQIRLIRTIAARIAETAAACLPYVYLLTTYD